MTAYRDSPALARDGEIGLYARPPNARAWRTHTPSLAQGAPCRRSPIFGALHDELPAPACPCGRARLNCGARIGVAVVVLVTRQMRADAHIATLSAICNTEGTTPVRRVAGVVRPPAPRAR